MHDHETVARRVEFNLATFFALHDLSASIRHVLPLVYIPCMIISVLDHSWPWMLINFCFFLGSIFTCIQLCLLKSVVNGLYSSSDLHEHSFHGTNDRTSNRIGARSIVRSLDHSRVFIAFSYNPCFYCTIVANTCRRIV